MPASDISRLSTPRADTAATIARQITNLQIKNKLQSGELRRDDRIAFERAYKTIYHAEYYRLYNLLEEQASTSRIIYLPTDNPAAKKFYCRHSPVRFTKTNQLIRVQNKRVLIGRFEFPIDEDISLETKEALISSWPGPLDKCVENYKSRVAEYIYALEENDRYRRIKYCNNDDHRMTILKLLRELLNFNGIINAKVINNLLVPEKSEIPKDDTTHRKPLEILEKHLLLGRLPDALGYARSKTSLDHAFILSVFKDHTSGASNLNEKEVLITAEHMINKLSDNKILKIVYKAFLDKILQSNVDINDIMKHNVGNNAYEFAIFSANDLPMDFDQSNEIFKLVTSIKQATLKQSSNYDLISLGFVTLDNERYDNSEDLSFRSHTSFNAKEDTYASRTLRISNIDMLIFNEIWEYCLNLAKGTCNTNNYEYLINLVPYKLIFAAKLFDYGLYDMFGNYLYSMQKALLNARQNPYLEKDSFYDWNTIEQSVEHMAEIWRLFRGEGFTRYQQEMVAPPPPPLRSYDAPDQYSPLLYNQSQNAFQPDSVDPAPLNDYPSLPYQDNLRPTQNIPIQAFNQLSIQQETNPFDPDPLPAEDDYNQQVQQQHHNQHHQVQQPEHHHNQQHQHHFHNQHHNQQQQQQRYPQNEPNQSYMNDYSNDSSRRPSIVPSQSMEMPIFSPPGFGTTNVQDRQNPKTMNSSSPVDRHRDSIQDGNYKIGESFNAPYSPINEYNDMSMPGPVGSNNNNISSPPQPPHQATSSSQQKPTSSYTNENQMTSRATGKSNTNVDNKPDQQSAGDQQSGFINNLFGNILKKSSSTKQMVLPDDSKPNIVWDKERNAWVDQSKPEEADAMNLNDAPPVPANVQPPTYSFTTKSAKSRYPKRDF